MATLSDLQITPTSGLNHIDALLSSGPDWNYLTPAGNTIFYTFSVASGNEIRDGVPITGQQAFSASQQMHARSAMQYISQLTGIVFTETSNGDNAQVHLCNVNLAGSTTTGLCSWSAGYRRNLATNEIVSYEAEAYVYLDNVEFASRNANLAPGAHGYETLLHELGHMLGLKHSFDDGIQLPLSQDSTAYTLMSYKDSGGPYSSFQSYDVAALNWLYGRDGLGGDSGINSLTGARFITGTTAADQLVGTPYNDTLQGDRGNDMINGGQGTDKAVFGASRASYQFSKLDNGDLLAVGSDGSDILRSVEIFEFSDGSFQFAQLVDSTPPPAPTVNVSQNNAGYVVGNTPFVFGISEANATMRIFNGATLLATGQVAADGFFTIPTIPLANGNYSLTVTSTDGAGNISAPASISFKVDATPPSVPTANVSKDIAGFVQGNQPLFTGTGETGTLINLINTGNEVIGQTVVGAGGNWSISANPLTNGNYSVRVQSTDAADNPTNAASPLTFSVASALNVIGTPGNDSLAGTIGNNALQGMGGIDTAVYAGARASYSVQKSTNGYTVNSPVDGFDSLLGVERIKFADSAVGLDINGTGGQSFRLYKAAFDRAPDLAGVGYWMNRMDNGTELRQVAKEFIAQVEFAAMYGSNNPSTQLFVEKLYLHVLHRPLDQAGFDFWVRSIDVQGATKAEVLVNFSESAENQAQVIGSIQNGFEYKVWEG